MTKRNRATESLGIYPAFLLRVVARFWHLDHRDWVAVWMVARHRDRRCWVPALALLSSPACQHCVPSPVAHPELRTPRSAGPDPKVSEGYAACLPAMPVPRSLPGVSGRPGLTPAQLTALNMDRTRQLEELAAERWGGDTAAVVGEMQFAFIAFAFGQSLQGESAAEQRAERREWGRAGAGLRNP